ncbi:hypothetical protein GCM10008931_44740 [Oceanobacillus oncorhynchi subsp. oncorhynchi]|uniref:hypothetical protein n=1 Tax=Oceanobacillus oncorhynchi TaxID=545501 RepID=UPI0031CF0C07
MRNKGKFVDGAKAGFGLLTDSLLDAGTDMGAEVAKESITDLAGELMVDGISSFIPGVSGAVSSYKRIRAEKNLTKLVYHLHNNHDKLIENLSKQTDENREKLDELLQFVLEIAIDEYQDEKIEYMVNGYINLTEHEEITSDFVMLYYDMLKQLRMVDIAVLRLYFRKTYLYDSKENHETFQHVMEKHGMSYEQYNSVRETLKRNGLLELEIKDDVDDDMSKLEDGINKVVNYIEHINSKRKSRPPKISNVKIKQKSKERVKLSKFGRDFYEFFGN